ncbi:ArsR family transcriptional regulator [Archaeoglobales archaeon]|nr:MAG: ArsR family transcriptional regulator [Archaeoglobales archaeon]
MKWLEFSDTIEKNREYHERYHKAVNNPIRKKILKMLKEGKNYDEMMNALKLNEKNFEYHLKLLEWGFCIERDKKDKKKIILTKEGEIVDYLGD